MPYYEDEISSESGRQGVYGAILVVFLLVFVFGAVWLKATMDRPEPMRQERFCAAYIKPQHETRTAGMWIFWPCAKQYGWTDT